MQKLKLDVEALVVETFPVAEGEDGAGTVHAHSGWTQCGGITCVLSLCPDCGGTVVGTAGGGE